MGSDSDGCAPEWWQWALSGAMVAAGIFLVATGAGGIAGGALICAGANSIVGSYVSEATGGSTTAGWAGGLITGTFCGLGAGGAGMLFEQATRATGFACLGNLAASGAVALGSGFMGSLLGQRTSLTIDNADTDTNTMLSNALTTGAINCLSSIGAGIGTALQGLPAIGTTSTALANSLNAAWSIASETFCDIVNVLTTVSLR